MSAVESERVVVNCDPSEIRETGWGLLGLAAFTPPLLEVTLAFTLDSSYFTFPCTPLATVCFLACGTRLST